MSTGFSRGSSLNDELPQLPELPMELKVWVKSLGSQEALKRLIAMLRNTFVEVSSEEEPAPRRTCSSPCF